MYICLSESGMLFIDGDARAGAFISDWATDRTTVYDWLRPIARLAKIDYGRSFEWLQVATIVCTIGR